MNLDFAAEVDRATKALATTLRAGMDLGRQDLARRIERLETAMEKVAVDMDKWRVDGIRPDEWKLAEWSGILRCAVMPEIGSTKGES